MVKYLIKYRVSSIEYRVSNIEYRRGAGELITLTVNVNSLQGVDSLAS